MGAEPRPTVGIDLSAPSVAGTHYPVLPGPAEGLPVALSSDSPGGAVGL